MPDMFNAILFAAAVVSVVGFITQGQNTLVIWLFVVELTCLFSFPNDFCFYFKPGFVSSLVGRTNWNLDLFLSCFFRSVGKELSLYSSLYQDDVFILKIILDRPFGPSSGAHRMMKVYTCILVNKKKSCIK